MSKQCFFCGKKSSTGNVVQRRGMAKAKGGVGKKTTSITKRRFKPNLQKVKADIEGVIKKVLACTKCIKANKVKRPVRKATL